ncbi:MAG: sigma-70 family RNA polymerase sigma factor [Treponema sp.]|nr:sigma-70 family RNA polymerase sigma factor [Treponema sp.]
MSGKTTSDTFRQFKQRLLKFILGKVHLIEDAEDILQEVFYQFSRMSDLANPVENTAAWLYRVAGNRIIDYYRKKKEDEYIDDDMADILFGGDTDPDTIYLRTLIQNKIKAAVAGLPQEQRKVFELTEFYNMPVKEVAEKTNVPVNTVLSRKHYAVKFLRAKLEESFSELDKI